MTNPHSSFLCLFHRKYSGLFCTSQRCQRSEVTIFPTLPHYITIFNKKFISSIFSVLGFFHLKLIILENVYYVTVPSNLAQFPYSKTWHFKVILDSLNIHHLYLLWWSRLKLNSYWLEGCGLILCNSYNVWFLVTAESCLGIVLHVVAFIFVMAVHCYCTALWKSKHSIISA